MQFFRINNWEEARRLVWENTGLLRAFQKGDDGSPMDLETLLFVADTVLAYSHDETQSVSREACCHILQAAFECGESFYLEIPMLNALCCSNFEIMTFLLDHAPTGNPILKARGYYNCATVATWIRNKSQRNENIGYLVRHASISAVDLLSQKDGAGQSPLDHLCQQERFEITKLFLPFVSRSSSSSSSTSCYLSSIP